MIDKRKLSFVNNLAQIAAFQDVIFVTSEAP